MTRALSEINDLAISTRPETSIALLRAGALNPFEMQAYEPLVDEFDLLAVGRRRPMYEVDRLPMTTVLLPSWGNSRMVRSLHRRSPVAVRRLIDPDALRGLREAVHNRKILHTAETALSASEQAARLCARTGAKLVLTCWETIPFRYDDDPVLAERKRLVHAQADRYIAVTQRARQALITEGVSAADIAVVPAAVDCERFKPEPGPTALRHEWGFSDDAQVVLYVGRLIQEKGIVELVRAFSRAGDAKAQLVIVGNGDQAKRIIIAAHACGVGSRVHLKPGVSYQRIPELYNSADIVAAPSLTTPYWEEQFGMVLAEAMACGRPLLTTSSGAIPEVVGSAAQIVAPYDNDALARELGRLLRSPQRQRAMGAQARDWAVSHYAVTTVAKQLAEVYRALADQ
jgi:glycosyltransferase involved in cell wall biosynthesis